MFATLLKLKIQVDYSSWIKDSCLIHRVSFLLSKSPPPFFFEKKTPYVLWRCRRLRTPWARRPLQTPPPSPPKQGDGSKFKMLGAHQVKRVWERESFLSVWLQRILSLRLRRWWVRQRVQGWLERAQWALLIHQQHQELDCCRGLLPGTGKSLGLHGRCHSQRSHPGGDGKKWTWLNLARRKRHCGRHYVEVDRLHSLERHILGCNRAKQRCQRRLCHSY